MMVEGDMAAEINPEGMTLSPSFRVRGDYGISFLQSWPRYSICIRHQIVDGFSSEHQEFLSIK